MTLSLISPSRAPCLLWSYEPSLPFARALKPARWARPCASASCASRLAWRPRPSVCRLLSPPRSSLLDFHPSRSRYSSAPDDATHAMASTQSNSQGAPFNRAEVQDFLSLRWQAAQAGESAMSPGPSLARVQRPGGGGGLDWPCRDLMIDSMLTHDSSACCPYRTATGPRPFELHASSSSSSASAEEVCLGRRRGRYVSFVLCMVAV